MLFVYAVVGDDDEGGVELAAGDGDFGVYFLADVLTGVDVGSV